MGRRKVIEMPNREDALARAFARIKELERLLDAERRQHAFDNAAYEGQVSILLRDLMQLKAQPISNVNRNGDEL
jgi:hypothetical protein